MTFNQKRVVRLYDFFYFLLDPGFNPLGFLIFDFILEKPATRPRDRCGKEQLAFPFVTGSPGSSRVSALAPYSSGGRVGSTLSTPHAGGDLGLFVGECSSPQTLAMP